MLFTFIVDSVLRESRLTSLPIILLCLVRVVVPRVSWAVRYLDKPQWRAVWGHHMRLINSPGYTGFINNFTLPLHISRGYFSLYLQICQILKRLQAFFSLSILTNKVGYETCLT